MFLHLLLCQRSCSFLSGDGSDEFVVLPEKAIHIVALRPFMCVVLRRRHLLCLTLEPRPEDLKGVRMEYELWLRQVSC